MYMLNCDQAAHRAKARLQPHARQSAALAHTKIWLGDFGEPGDLGPSSSPEKSNGASSSLPASFSHDSSAGEAFGEPDEVGFPGVPATITGPAAFAFSAFSQAAASDFSSLFLR